MSRTMTKKDCEKFKKFVDNLDKEMTEKAEIIDFLHCVGFCDKEGNIIYPYN